MRSALVNDWVICSMATRKSSLFITLSSCFTTLEVGMIVGMVEVIGKHPSTIGLIFCNEVPYRRRVTAW